MGCRQHASISERHSSSRLFSTFSILTNKMSFTIINMTSLPYALVLLFAGVLYLVVIPAVQYFRDPKGEWCAPRGLSK